MVMVNLRAKGEEKEKRSAMLKSSNGGIKRTAKRIENDPLPASGDESGHRISRELKRKRVRCVRVSDCSFWCC